MNSMTADKTVDCRGLSCPMPIVRAKKAIEEIQPGQVLEVVATDPGSVADVKSWASRTGQEFLGMNTGDGVFWHYIRKANPDEVRAETTYPHVVTNQTLLQTLESKPVIIDVREPMEYAFGHIPGAQLFPMGTLEDSIARLGQYADHEVFVVCKTGNRSDVACQILAEKGFSQVRNVVPGMSGWEGPIEVSEVNGG